MAAPGCVIRAPSSPLEGGRDAASCKSLPGSGCTAVNTSGGLLSRSHPLGAGDWLHTGDIATRDKDGFYYLVGRAKDMIISGGFNVYPKEVEDVIAMDPAVAAVAVIGVPDATWGEAVKACVVPKPGASIDVERIIASVTAAKGSVDAPKSIDIVDAIPLTPLGKPDKVALRARSWGGEARAIA